MYVIIKCVLGQEMFQTNGFYESAEMSDATPFPFPTNLDSSTVALVIQTG